MNPQTTIPVAPIDRLQRVANNQKRLLRYDVLATAALFAGCLIAALSAAL